MPTLRKPLLVVLTGVALACGRPVSDDPDRALLGGDATIFDDTAEAFYYPARNLSPQLRGPFQIGDSVFNRNWVIAPATPQGNDGLGPTFNALSCSGCHQGNGRGAPPTSEAEPFLGLLVRLSVPGTDAHGGPPPDPRYGGQFNSRSILGVPSEGEPAVSYVEVPGAYGDQEPYSLRMPRYSFPQLHYGPLAADILISPRVAPQLSGIGLLEAVPEETLVGFAEANAQGGGPIHGHVNRVWDTKARKTVLGRFGWKANQPSAEQQTLAAFLGDIGITSSRYTEENCPPAQTACVAAGRSLTQPELTAIKEEAVVTHTLALGVAARRHLDDPAVARGETLFAQAQCAACHLAKMETGTLPGYPELSNQTIRPFTDLLLHDLGPGLADGRPDYLASGSEWRTPPLWGVGLIQTVNDHSFLLHDGRARGFAEAILWHSGEAEESKEAFRQLPKADRAALVAFLQSL